MKLPDEQEKVQHNMVSELPNHYSFTTNQPIGSTVSDTPIFSDGANPPPHQGSEWQTEPPKRTLEQQLCDVLMNHTGEHGQNEGAVECLERIIRERDLLLKRAMEDMLKPAHY